MREIKVTEEFIKEQDQYRVPPEGVGLLEACSNNIILFSEKMLGLKLYSWQIYFLRQIQKRMQDSEDVSSEFVALTSRQIGKSTALAVLSVWACVFNKYPGTVGNNTIVGIASATDTQAKKLLYEMKKYIMMGDAFMRDTYVKDGKPSFGDLFFTNLLDDGQPNNTTTISFKRHDPTRHSAFVLKGSKTGSVIKSYPPTSVVLGETFTMVIIDEAGKSDKISDQFFYDFMYPTGNSTNAVRIYTSTPWSSSGFFYRMVDPDEMYGESPADVVVFTIDAIEEENPRQFKTVLNTVAQLQKDGKQDEVQRAYYCRFVKGEQSYFDPEDTLKAFDGDLLQHDSFAGFCDLGVDFGGQVSSRTVLTVSHLNDQGDVIRIAHKTYEVGKDGTIIDDITELKTRYNIQRIIPDECPQGDYLIRKMKDMGWDITPMNFRSEKVKKYGAFRSMLKKGLIKSYKDDALQTEMLAMEYSHGSRQSVIQHAPGYSDDLIDSFLLSVYHYLQDDSKLTVFDWDNVSGGAGNTDSCPNCQSDSIFRKDMRTFIECTCQDCPTTWRVQ
jgi:hypothetical protein